MGFYYGPESNEPAPQEKPPGCMDVIVITRAVFSVLLWPMVALFAVVIDVGAIFWAFSIHPALALIPIGLTVLVVWLFSRWEQRNIRSDGLDN